MARTYNDPAEDAAYYARARQSFDQISAARSWATPAAAQAVSTMAANYPHMSAGLVMPLADANVSPDDPLAQHVATESAKQGKRKRGFWGAVGDHVNPFKYLSGAGEMFTRDVLNPAGGAGLSALKWGTRTGTAVLGAPLEFGTGVVRDVAAVGGNIAAGVATGAAVGGATGSIFGGIGALPGAIGGGIIGGVAGGLAEMRGVDVQSEGVQNPFAQTTLGQQLTGHSAGSGYFAAGAAHEAAAEASRKAAAINGHALTPGRFLASSVLEPGTAPYNLISGLMDTAVTWELDPANKLLGKTSAWRKNAKAFVPENLKAEVGLVDAARKSILPEKVDQWLGSKQGANAVQWLADQTDFDLIRRQLGKGKVDVSTVLDLTNARTPEEVAGILRPRLGLDKGLEIKPRVGTAGFEVKRLYQDSARAFNEMPSGKLDLNDPTAAVEEFDRLQRTAKIDHGVISANNEAMANHLVKGDRMAAKRLMYEQFWGGNDGVLAKHNVLPEVRRKLGKQLADFDEMATRRFIMEDGTKTATPVLLNGGKVNPLTSPGFLAAGTDDVINFDRNAVRNIRRATSFAPGLTTSRPWAMSVTQLDNLMTDLWKPMQLIRGAWTTRVVGEEQLRMSVAGESSIFKHPMSHLSWMLADDGNISKIFKKFGIDVSEHTGVGGADITGTRFAAEGSTIIPNHELDKEMLGAFHDFADATNVEAQAGGWLDGTNVVAKHTATYQVGDPNYHQAWAEKIEQLHRDPVTRRLAGERSSEVRKWFADGEGSQIRKQLADKGAPLRSNADIDRHIENARKNVNQAVGVVEGTRMPAQALTPGGMTAGEISTMRQSAQAAKPGNSAIRNAIATGEYGGVPIHNPNGTLNKDFVAKLKDLEDGPATMIGSAVVTGGGAAALKESWDQGVRTLFSKFMTRPSAKLSRSPMFRQTYWKEAENVVFAMDDASKAALLENAVAAKLPEAQLARLRQRASLGSGEVSILEADDLLKGRALDATQTLLYDTAQRGQLSDVMRLIAPFAEAQKEVFKVWAKVGTEHPEVGRRLQQVVQGARGSGFFHTDPSTGQEMFSFPGSSFLTEKLLGVPVPLSGNVQGLNVFGSGILPGVGPAAQIPARWILADKPQYADFRKLIDPMGSGATEQGGILEQQLPAWFKKVSTAIAPSDSDRTFANAVKDIWSSGVSAGRYRADTPEDIKEGLDHARTQARKLYALRGVASLLGAPTAPTPDYMAMDKNQHWIVTEKLANDYRAMMDKDPDNANQQFLDKYGNNAFAFMQAKSYSTVASAPTSTNAADWLGKNQGIAGKYSDVIGLFAPQGEDFDYATYVRNLKSGATQSLTPEQFVRAANDKVGKMVFYNAKDRFGPAPSKQQREWLSGFRQVLRKEFPGFDETLPGKPDQETIKNKYIPQIAEAVNDPKLADNKVAQATKVYLLAREKATAAAQAAGYAGFTQSKAAAPIREWLRNFSDVLVKEVPDFAAMRDRIFDREMLNDSQQTAPGAAA